MRGAFKVYVVDLNLDIGRLKMAFEIECKCPHCGNDEFSNEWAVKNEIDLIDDDEVGDVRCPKCGCVFYVETERVLTISVFDYTGE